MKFELFNKSQSQEVITLFIDVFTNSEGETEGKVIGELVNNLITTTRNEDLIGFVAQYNNQVCGSIFFSSLKLGDKTTAFILSPVAIATSEQGKGLGKKLIGFGLDYLKSKGIDFVFTYGDPKFYSKVGFQQISETIVKAPLNLSHPEGWLAKSLNERSIEQIHGQTECVEALNNQQYW